MTAHEMFDGRVQLFKRGRSRYWQCNTRIEGDRHRTSTGEENLTRAMAFAEEWYLDLRGKLRAGVQPGKAEPKKKEKSFGEAAESYLREARVLAISVRSPKYIEYMELRMNRHVLPYFKDMPLSSINRGVVQAYRVKRAEETIELTKTKDAPGRPPARSTMLQEIVHIRQVLKHAEGNGWLQFVPNLSMPYMTQGKKGRRAWFAPNEYEKLYKATRRRADECPRRGHKSQYEDLHDLVLFMANTGVRPDEALRLEFRDVKVEDDYATKQTILVMDVRGKTGVGYCKSTERAVHPFSRVRERRLAELTAKLGADAAEQALPTTNLFPKYNRDLFQKILIEEGLRTDREGKRRTLYSLRHTYISNRLIEGANIHQIANNCRTSVQMIEEHYASHIKDRLDAAAINVQRPKAARRAGKRRDETPQQGSPKPAAKRKAKQ